MARAASGVCDKQNHYIHFFLTSIQILVDDKNTAFGIKMKRGGQVYTVLAKKEVNCGIEIFIE